MIHFGEVESQASMLGTGYLLIINVKYPEKIYILKLIRQVASGITTQNLSSVSWKHWSTGVQYWWKKICKHRHGMHNESLCIVYTVLCQCMCMYSTRNLYLGKCDLWLKDLLKWAKLLSGTWLSVMPCDLVLLLLIHSLLCDRNFQGRSVVYLRDYDSWIMVSNRFGFYTTLENEIAFDL